MKTVAKKINLTLLSRKVIHLHESKEFYYDTHFADQKLLKIVFNLPNDNDI